jgi:ABC-type phosphate transport system substrate-binding protein
MPEAWQKQPLTYKDLPPDTDLAITLDQHLYPALLPLIREFARERELRVAVQEGTCGISAGALADKEVDIGGFCCPTGEPDRLPGLRYHTLGIASLALLVNPKNPVEDVDTETARRVFNGDVADWQDVAAEKDRQKLPAIAPIQAVARLHCKNRPGHWRLILDNEDEFSPTLLEVSTIQDMIQRVARLEDAVGYETLWMIERYGKGTVKWLSVNGISPTDDAALIANKYPFYRTYNISSWSAPHLAKPEADALVAYLIREFHRVDPRYGFVPAAKLREAGWRFHNDELIGEPLKTSP